MKIIERAARVLWDMSGRPMKADDVSPSMRVPTGEPDWERFTPIVRQLLLSIREPDEDMLTADPTGLSGSCFPEDIWRAMIDAALSEQA
jgi:hypothetical protein